MKRSTMSFAVKILASAGVATSLLAVTVGPASADDRDHWREHQWHAQDWHGRDWREHHPAYIAPPVVVAPPARVVYAPPPVIVSPPPVEPGLSVVLPIHIR